MKIRKNMFPVIFMLCIISIISAGLVNTSAAETTSSSDEKIGISWRADTDSEFYTNITETLENMGIDYVMLDQVFLETLSYENNEVSTQYINENSYLDQEAADIVKNADYNETNVEAVLEDIDGVIFTGGEDISPTLYKEPQDWHGIEEEKDYNATRDVNDYILMSYCIDNDIPTMGFCRGMQILGIVSGATVIQDIPVYFENQDIEYDYIHRNNKETPDSYRDYSAHDVTVTDTDSILYQIVGDTSLKSVPSWHHQALLSVDDCNLKITGVTNTCGIDMIEAIERTDKTFIAGFQFHPEASVVKHLHDSSNADDFISLETAEKFFTVFIDSVSEK